jgi:N-acetylglucosamine-6-sulfatase
MASAVAAMVVLVGGCDGDDAGDERASASGPHFVVVVTDDQEELSYGQRVMPNVVELLGERGTTFEDAIVTTPACCPSRASMLTGQYAHNHGVLTNSPGYRRLIDPDNVLPVWLQEAGYRTIHIGKYLNGYKAVEGFRGVPPGWDEWHSNLSAPIYYDYDMTVNGQVVHQGDDDRSYVTRVINRKAVGLARRFSSEDQPFYLQIDHNAPHRGRGRGEPRCGGTAVPDPSDQDAFAGEDLPRPPSFNEDDVSDKPSFIRRRGRLAPAEVANIKRQHGCRLASLVAVDRGVKRLHRVLKRTGALERTVFIFISDNGFFQGQHRIGAKKQFSYEEGIRVPLVMSVPSRYLDGERVPVSDEPVANIDLPPTILELAGAEPCRSDGKCRTMDGRSLVPLLEGDRGAWPDERALALDYGPGRGDEKDDRPCVYRGVRREGLVYVENTSAAEAGSGRCRPVDEHELYDVRDDPFQLDNLLATDPRGSAEAEAEMAALLARLRECAGIEGRDPEPQRGDWCE